jgi:LPS-assembly protein
MTRQLAALALALALALAAPAAGQNAPPPASLVADRIDFGPDRLTASGGVEVFADGRILRAMRVTYLRDEDRILVEGPLTLIDGDDAILVAEFASLSADLRASVLTGARLVLDAELQIAAERIATGPEGRLTELSRTVASSCEVCAARPVPLWQIRAERILHDREARRLTFENARFEVAGIPIAWLPRMRLPDPTVERATGLLAPRFSSDDLLGTGVAVPYFIALGPSRDLTLVPYATTTETRQLGFRYRQAFESGVLAAEGALARDTVRRGEARGYFFADGTFLLPRDYRLEFDVEAVSDDTYLLNYDVTEKDRLDSRLAITRIDREDRFTAEALLFESLRADEDDRFLPTRVVTVERQRRRPGAVLGGQLTWTLQAQGRERTASEAPPGGPSDAARDALRASAALDWQRSRVAPWGLVTTALAGLDLDAYEIRQDDDFEDETLTRAVPYAGLELRLPLVRAGAAGVSHLLEPVAQLILAPDDRTVTPDEDSLTPEFDGGNLFSPQRFAGRDTRELGNRLNLGLGYHRQAPGGWQVGALVGRVIRQDDLDQFRSGTGLDGATSDWLIGATATWRDRFAFLTRSTFDDGLTFSRSETGLAWSRDDTALETTFTWLEADDEAGRPIDTSEWAVDAAIGLGGDWTGRANWRYDFVTDDASRAGLGLTYRSDCVTVDFGVERRFTSNDALEPSTSFGFGVELVGFGADSGAPRRRRCGI